MMETLGQGLRGLELWDTEDVPPKVPEEATSAALAVLDAEMVSPIEARFARFHLEVMDDRGDLHDGADLASGGVNEAHLNAGRRAETAAIQIIQRLVPDRAEPYIMLGVEEWALDRFQATNIDPTKIP